jgi:hypothetical protein
MYEPEPLAISSTPSSPIAMCELNKNKAVSLQNQAGASPVMLTCIFIPQLLVALYLALSIILRQHCPTSFPPLCQE